MFVRSSKLGQHLGSSIKQHVDGMSQQLILNVGVSDKAEKLNQHCFTFAFCSSTLFIVFIMIAVESSVYCFDQKKKNWREVISSNCYLVKPQEIVSTRVWILLPGNPY